MTHAQLQQEATKQLQMKYMQQQQQLRLQQQLFVNPKATGADSQVPAAALLKTSAASSLLPTHNPQSASPISELPFRRSKSCVQQ